MSILDRTDPQRLGLLRRQFLAAMRREILTIQQDVWQLVAVQDAFGLRQSTFSSPWQSLPIDQKLVSFQSWLDGEYNKTVLRPDTHTGRPWITIFTDRAYQRGVQRSYSEHNITQGVSDWDAFLSGRAQFTRLATTSPQGLSQQKLVTDRVVEQSKGTLTDISQGLNRILTIGLTRGESPQLLARKLSYEVRGLDPKLIGNSDLIANAKKKKGTDARASRLVNSELSYAHSEGQLDAMALLGLRRVGILAEWVTADNPCPQCEEFAGKTYILGKAHGMIPLHPNCRCAWRAIYSSGRGVRPENFRKILRRIGFPSLRAARRRTR